MGEENEELSTRSWKHAFVWVNDNLPIWVCGSDLRDQGCCTSTRMCLELSSKGGEVLGLLLEQSGNVAVFEIVLYCVD